MTALSIAQRLGYISVVEELKVVTETTIASKHELITEERYKVNIRINLRVLCFFNLLCNLDSSTRSIT
jgi:hypothetical protein